ncbi:rRNA maturation RNase YbeY [Salinispirillum marinum]|uniref:Endoribonuclease YbeY n=2 Tax=Saccharospirillaceae TaxID=255527 RepID=A0ABV8BIN7_9GAMM
MITPHIHLQDVCTTAGMRPTEGQIVGWLGQIAERLQAPIELTVRLVDNSESQALNARYRQKDKPTNVLSFPFEAPPEFTEDPDYLGDLVVCLPVVNDEAIAQGKPELHHWAHMVIHGTLHLLGYDHIDDADAEEMEDLERELLAALNIPDPYLLTTDGSESLTP